MPVSSRPTRDAWLVFGVLFVASLVTALVLRRIIFGEPLISWGDYAANDLLVLKAQHFTLLEGHYSRTGTNHPGPDWLYLLAGGETLFYQWLHLVPGPFNADLLAQIIIQCVAIASVGGVTAGLTRSPLVGLFMGAATFWGFVGWFGPNPYLPYALGDVWPPYASFTFMAAALPFAVAVACGRTAYLPGLVLAGGLLIHTHVAFFLVFGGTFVGIVVSWFVLHRRGVRAELGRHRLALVLAGVALLLVVGPIILRTALDWPEPWQSWFGFTKSLTSHPTWSGIAFYFFSDLNLIGIPWWVYPLGALVGAGVIALDRNPWRRRLAATSFGVMLLFVILTVIYVKRAVDYISPVEVFGYIIVYILILPPLFLAIVLVHLASNVVELMASRDGARRAVVCGLSAGVGVVASVALFVPAALADPRASYATQPELTSMARAGERLAAFAATHGELGLYVEDPTIPLNFATVFLAAKRADSANKVCGYYAEGGPSQKLPMSDTFPCSGRPEWAVEFTRKVDASSGTVLWSVDSTMISQPSELELVLRPR